METILRIAHAIQSWWPEVDSTDKVIILTMSSITLIGLGFFAYLIHSAIMDKIRERRADRRREEMNRMTEYDYYTKRGNYSNVTIRGMARYKWRCVKCSLLPNRERIQGGDVVIADPHEALEHIHHHRTEGDKIPDHAIVRIKEDIAQWERRERDMGRVRVGNAPIFDPFAARVRGRR